MKPDILKELAEDNGLPPPPKRDKYVSDDDDAVFEDDLQRIKLRGSNFDVGSIVTGVVCAFLGSERESGKFFVEKVFFPRPPMQVERPLPQQDRFIAFISGLELASKSSDALGPFQLALDWLLGEAGDVDEVKWVANIERVVVAGNSLAEATKDRSHLSQAKYLTKDRVAGSVEAVALLDDLLVQLAAGLEVDIMPGEFDPANQVQGTQHFGNEGTKSCTFSCRCYRNNRFIPVYFLAPPPILPSVPSQTHTHSTPMELASSVPTGRTRTTSCGTPS